MGRSVKKLMCILVVAVAAGASCAPGGDSADPGGDQPFDVPAVGRSAADSPAGSPADDAGSVVDAAGSVTEADDPDTGEQTDQETPAASSGPPETIDPAVEIEPAGGDVRALLSPTGVLVGVAGELDGNYVVETPCGHRSKVVWGQPLGDVQVVIDPGHGGDEPGAVSGPTEEDPDADVPEMTEAVLNLRVARRTAALLADRSITAVLTRNGDYRIPIRQRAALADRIGPDVFVSIHHNTPNSAPSPTPGTEVYVQSGSDVSKRLGGVLYEDIVAALGQFDVEWSSRIDAGVLTVLDDDGEDAYGIARYPQTPSALLEVAYLGNPKEAVLLVTQDYVDAAAEGIADGIERYLTTEDPGAGFVDEARVFNPSSDGGGEDGCIDPPLQ